MKLSRIFLAFIPVFFLAIPSANALEAFVRNSVFHTNDAGAYVETDIFISGTGIQFKKQPGGKYKGATEVTLVYRQGEQTAAFDKYILHSIETADSASFAASLIDKKRFPLASGSYTLTASFRDMNDSQNVQTLTEPFSVSFDTGKVELSDIMLIDTFYQTAEPSIYARNDYYMVPQVLNYFPDGINKISFYAEIYNTDKLHDQALVSSYIRKFKENGVVGNLSAYKKISANPVNVLLSEFDISALYTGNYYLVVEVRDRNNNLLAMKQLFFQRSKTLEATAENLSKLFIENTFAESLTNETADYHLKSILPIAALNEGKKIRELLKGAPLLDKQRYFLLFWMTRNETNPTAEWQKYAQTIKMVNDNYGTTIEYGFETDRGRVRLTYGAPTDILESEREPGALPYEIWQYNRLDDGQMNVKFVFYNPDLVTNNYVLIHSTANGEIKNEYWQRLVYEPFVGGNSPTESGTEIRDHYGSKATDYYKKE